MDLRGSIIGMPMHQLEHYDASARGSVEMNITSVCVSGLLNRVNRVSRVAVWSAGGARPASVCGAVEPDGRTAVPWTKNNTTYLPGYENT